jgi:uncharacterized protein YaiI (UPF0178 family)
MKLKKLTFTDKTKDIVVTNLMLLADGVLVINDKGEVYTNSKTLLADDSEKVEIKVNRVSKE